MDILGAVIEICRDLAPHGWRDLLLKVTSNHIDIASDDLEDQLSTSIPTIDRDWPGFEDFISSGDKGIEPGHVAASLLFHAFASPGVQFAPSADGESRTRIQVFPTLEQLDTIECYIYAAAKRSIEDVRQLASDLLSISEDDVELVVATFAEEYRPCAETVHQRYADLCLSRTGVARVGTAHSRYDGRLRGYFPFQDGDSHTTIRVLPCKYTTWLAVKSGAIPNRFGPARATEDDEDLEFIVPVHRLFNGEECLNGLDLKLQIEAAHVNQKLAKLHERMEQLGFDTGFSKEDRKEAPFTETNGLASFIETYPSGAKLLEPIPQPLAKRAAFDGRPLSFPSPDMNGSGFGAAFSPSLSFSVRQGRGRPYPEYAHVRFEVEDGNTKYFGGKDDTVERATSGGYQALNLTDGTADGWVRSTVEALDEFERRDAYSLVAAPDFFPSVDQREVFEWWENAQDDEVKPTLPKWQQELLDEGYWDFWLAAPFPLSDERKAPNFNLTQSEFLEDDFTVSCVLAPLQNIDRRASCKTSIPTRRHAVLPDSAAGVFAPGWDVSADQISGAPIGAHHLSAYGLGSPFPEDAKLCAALSTFWPAAAPDTTRSFFSVNFSKGTVCPLTDEENGAAAEGQAWDGLRGPRILSEDASASQVRYPSYEQADYTLSALEGQFSIARTQNVTLHDYIHRILATLRMYRRFKKREEDKNDLRILSFRRLNADDQFLLDAERDSGAVLRGPVYKFEVFNKTDATRVNPDSFIEEDYRVTKIFTLLIGTDDFFLVRDRRGDGSAAETEWTFDPEPPRLF